MDAANPFLIAEMRLMDPTTPALTGGAGPVTSVSTGLADFSAFALCRVKHIAVRLKMNSYEGTQNLHAVCFFSDTQPSTVITTYLLSITAATNYLMSKEVDMGVASGQSKSGPIAISASTKQILRDNMVLNDRDFVCTINPAHIAPNQQLWFGLVLYNAITTTNIVNGVSITLEASLRVHGFSRLPTA